MNKKSLLILNNIILEFYEKINTFYLFYTTLKHLEAFRNTLKHFKLSLYVFI